VRARLVYDADQLEAIAESDLDVSCGCVGGKAALSALARSMTGKVWSAKIFARKPV